MRIRIACTRNDQQVCRALQRRCLQWQGWGDMFNLFPGRARPRVPTVPCPRSNVCAFITLFGSTCATNPRNPHQHPFLCTVFRFKFKRLSTRKCSPDPLGNPAHAKHLHNTLRRQVSHECPTRGKIGGKTRCQENIFGSVDFLRLREQWKRMFVTHSRELNSLLN